MSFSAATFAELGTRMPVSASEAAYVEKAFNRRWLSLGVGLLVVVTAIISAATNSVGSAGYLGVLVDLPHLGSSAWSLGGWFSSPARPPASR